MRTKRSIKSNFLAIASLVLIASVMLVNCGGGGGGGTDAPNGDAYDPSTTGNTQYKQDMRAFVQGSARMPGASKPVSSSFLRTGTKS